MGELARLFRQVLEAATTRRGVVLMGVCNVTPDSFSDGGLFLADEAARARVDAILAEGADVVDVGGESTRPGARAVSAAEQLARVLPAVRHAVARGACVSIDTQDPEVAEACLAAGAAVVNDVSCLADERLAEVTARAGAALVLMHSRRSHFEVGARLGDEVYGDVVADVLAELRAAAERARAWGVEALVVDPGLGFAKTAQQSAELLRRTREVVRGAGVPVLIGASRKSFLRIVDAEAAPEERLGASIAAALWAVRGGARLVRVHDVRATRQAVDLEREVGRAAEGLYHLISPRPWIQVFIDLLDLVLVTYVVYRALLVLRGTRAMQMGTGLGVIFLIYVGARWAGFVTLYNLLSTLLSSIILIVVVVFQNDIRRGLMRVGSRAFLGGISRQQESRVIDEVVAAATELARHRTGALICLEQDANLDEFVVGQGTSLDAIVQRELLVTLFFPDNSNKLHDGAVIIRNLRIAKAGVFFPMPDTKVLDKSLGSRHRAAIGITEETDAVVIVVSEERGSISVCYNSNIIVNLDGAQLRQVLLGIFGHGARKKRAAQKGRTGGATGTFRITIPPPTPSPVRPSSAPPPPPLAVPTGAAMTPPSAAAAGQALSPPMPTLAAAPASHEKTGSVILGPAIGATVPMPTAKPIDTSTVRSRAYDGPRPDAPTRPTAEAEPSSSVTTPRDREES